jgi:hypothetical protein
MPIPFPLVLKAADALKREALSNRRLSPETRVAMMLKADAMPRHWIGRLLLEHALSEKD